MPPSWDPHEVFSIDPLADSPTTCIGTSKSKPQNPGCRNPIGRPRRIQAARLLDDMSKLSISGVGYSEASMKEKIRRVQGELLCGVHKNGGRNSQATEVEKLWWENLKRVQDLEVRYMEYVAPHLRIGEEAPVYFARFQDRARVRAVVPEQLPVAPIAQPQPQHQGMNENISPVQIRDWIRSLVEDEVDVSGIERSLEDGLGDLDERQQATVRRWTDTFMELERFGIREEVARQEEDSARREWRDQVVRRAEEERQRQETARGEEERRQIHQEKQRQEDMRRQQIARRQEEARQAEEQARIREEAARQEAEIRIQRELAEHMFRNQASAQQLRIEDDERREEELRQPADRQEVHQLPEDIRQDDWQPGVHLRLARFRYNGQRARRQEELEVDEWIRGVGARRNAQRVLQNRQQQQPPRPNPEIHVFPFPVPLAVQQVVLRKPLAACFACFEPIRAFADAQWCRGQCGQNICNGCFEQWRVSQPVGRELRCCVCRAVWKWEREPRGRGGF